MNSYSTDPEDQGSQSSLNQVHKELRDYKFALDQCAVVAVTDVLGKIIYANDKFCEVSKYSREELIGKTHGVINSGYHPQEFFKDLWETIQDGRIWKNEVRNKAKDGTYFWDDTTIVPFLDSAGKPYQYLVIRVDITLRKEIEEKFKKAMEIKSQFTSLVSHELRTPLTAIKQGIDIVDSGTAGQINAQQKEFLGIAKKNVDRLARLINSVLDFQKLQAGKMEFSMREDDLNDVMTDVHKTMRPLVEAKPIELRVEIDSTLPKINFDRDKIIQVLTNLVNNAIKFTAKGFIDILVQKEGNTAHVTVTDTGIGFAEKDKDRLFHSFEQLEGGQKSPGGTGLGLAICKEIIDRHNGKIWATSKEGMGSVFHFTLPIVERRLKNEKL